jgi:excinuclease ABC subunit A
MDKIEVRGARTHNLKNINLVIPRDKLIVVTGLSGSGKSSLAFDTLYAEGQRRYVESLSAYARQFLSLMEKPDVDHIEGLSPAISIEQKSTSHNPRSTVGTITEIHDYLRLLYARVGEPRCPDHDVPLAAQTVSQMVDNVLAQPEGKRLMLLSPIIKERKGEHTKTLENLASQGYIRARIDGEVCDLSDPPKLELQKKHTIEVVIDRFKVREDMATRLADNASHAAIHQALRHGYRGTRIGLVIFGLQFERHRFAADGRVLLVNIINRQLSTVFQILTDTGGRAGQRACQAYDHGFAIGSPAAG